MEHAEQRARDIALPSPFFQGGTSYPIALSLLNHQTAFVPIPNYATHPMFLRRYGPGTIATEVDKREIRAFCHRFKTITGMQVYTIREPGGIRFSLAPVPVDRNPFERPFEWFPIENPQSPFGLPLHNQESPQTMTTIDSEPVDTDTSGHLASRLLQLFKPLIECSKTINTLLSESKIPHSLVLKLPRIAVVGTESAGKSTVIQRLARRKLFPTGDTITTRMPIVLDLRHTDSDQVSIKLSKDDGQGMDDVDPDADLEQEIKTRTTVMLSQHNGHAKGVMSKEFRIQVHANDVTNMELMDLPGLVSVATLSGEPENLPTATREITESYVKDPNTMVLMIVPGNERSRNSLISTIIQQLGAEHRTIGVLTKCDLLVEREYETLLKKMRGDPTYSLPLQLGYVALNSGDNRAISFDNVIHQEQAFFKHFFDTLNTNPHTVGIESLVKVISSEYPKFCVSRIRGFQAHLSTIKTAVEKRLQELIEITPQLFQSVKDEKFCSGSWKTLDMTQIVGYHTFWNGSLSSVLSPMNDYQTHSGGRKLAIWADPTATVRMKHAIKTCTSIETTIKPLYEKLLDSYKSQIIRTFQEGTQNMMGFKIFIYPAVAERIRQRMTAHFGNPDLNGVRMLIRSGFTALLAHATSQPDKVCHMHMVYGEIVLFFYEHVIDRMQEFIDNEIVYHPEDFQLREQLQTLIMRIDQLDLQAENAIST